VAWEYVIQKPSCGGAEWLMFGVKLNRRDCYLRLLRLNCPFKCFLLLVNTKASHTCQIEQCDEYEAFYPRRHLRKENDAETGFVRVYEVLVDVKNIACFEIFNFHEDFADFEAIRCDIDLRS
jgi:hypothetical protein